MERGAEKEVSNIKSNESEALLKRHYGWSLILLQYKNNHYDLNVSGFASIIYESYNCICVCVCCQIQWHMNSCTQVHCTQSIIVCNSIGRSIACTIWVSPLHWLWQFTPQAMFVCISMYLAGVDAFVTTMIREHAFIKRHSSHRWQRMLHALSTQCRPIFFSQELKLVQLASHKSVCSIAVQPHVQATSIHCTSGILLWFELSELMDCGYHQCHN